MQDDYQDKDDIDSLPTAGGIKVSVCAAEVVDIYSQEVNVGPVALLLSWRNPFQSRCFIFFTSQTNAVREDGEVELISFIMPF